MSDGVMSREDMLKGLQNCIDELTKDGFNTKADVRCKLMVILANLESYFQFHANSDDGAYYWFNEYHKMVDLNGSLITENKRLKGEWR